MRVKPKSIQYAIGMPLISNAQVNATSGPRSPASIDISAIYVGTVQDMNPIPKPQRIRPAMICPTDQELACMTAPTTTNALPRRMMLRRPRGMPMIETMRQQMVAARVYEDAIIGMTYVPVGY